MESEEFSRLYLMAHARAEMQRIFLGMLLRRLARDVPGFSLDLLSDEMHTFLENALQPENMPTPHQALSAKTANEELRRLIETVEQAIANAKDDAGG